MTDTDPTPERRWRVDEEGFLLSPEGDAVAEVVYRDSPHLLATLNEAETLRAERDALTERVRVLEAALTGLLSPNWGHMRRREEANVDARYVRKMLERLGADVYDPTGEFRAVLAAEDALAGTEPPDAGEMLGGLLREQASRKWAGADGGERRE